MTKKHEPGNGERLMRVGFQCYCCHIANNAYTEPLPTTAGDADDDQIRGEFN